MRAFVLQDWLTIRGGTSITQVIQNEANYAALDAYQDVIMWLQVSEVTTSGGTITMNYETAPLKDESLFTAMATQGISTVAMSPPTISKVLLGQNPAVPLSKWMRWRITAGGSFTAAWDMTFRVLLVANQQVTFAGM